MSKISPAKSLLLTALAAAVFCSSVATSAAADTLLRFKFKVGDKLNYEVCQTMDNSMVMAGGKTMSTKMQSTITISQEVKSVDVDGKATVVITLDRMKMSMTIPMGEQPVEYDSAEEKEQEGMGKVLAEQFGQIVGKPIEMKIDAMGNTSDMKLPEGLKKGIFSKVFGGNNMKNMCGGISFPKEAVATGKTWTAMSAMPGVAGMGKGTIEQTYKYMGTEAEGGENLEKIELTATITLKPAENGPAKMAIKDQETKGEILFNNKTGRLQNSKTISKMTFDMEMMGQSMTSSVETNVEIKLLPKTGAK